jgi:hypothetical protein
MPRPSSLKAFEIEKLMIMGNINYGWPILLEIARGD